MAAKFHVTVLEKVLPFSSCQAFEFISGHWLFEITDLLEFGQVNIGRVEPVDHRGYVLQEAFELVKILDTSVTWRFRALVVVMMMLMVLRVRMAAFLAIQLV